MTTSQVLVNLLAGAFPIAQIAPLNATSNVFMLSMVLHFQIEASLLHVGALSIGKGEVGEVVAGWRHRSAIFGRIFGCLCREEESWMGGKTRANRSVEGGESQWHQREFGTA